VVGRGAARGRVMGSSVAMSWHTLAVLAATWQVGGRGQGWGWQCGCVSSKWTVECLLCAAGTCETRG